MASMYLGIYRGVQWQTHVFSNLNSKIAQVARMGYSSSGRGVWGGGGGVMCLFWVFSVKEEVVLSDLYLSVGCFKYWG